MAESPKTTPDINTKYIISNKTNLKHIPDLLIAHKNTMILKTKEVACQLKYNPSLSYILLAPECPLHLFKTALRLEPTTINTIFKSSYIIIDEEIKIISSTVNPPEIQSFVEINTEIEEIYKYFFYHNNNIKPKFSLPDKTKFLISRLSKIEKAKTKTIFGIFFTSIFYENLVNKLRIFLHSINKKVYKFFLRDINETRLNCFDGIECIIVVDCPFQIEFIDFHIPVLVPYEIQIAFGDNWKGEYIINRFDLKPEFSKETQLMKIIYATGKLVKHNNSEQAVQYQNISDNEEPQILMGFSGIPNSYEHHIKEKRFLIKLDNLKTSEIELNSVLNLSKQRYSIKNIYDRYYLITCTVEAIDFVAIRCFGVITIEVVLDEEYTSSLEQKYVNFNKKFNIFCEKNKISPTEGNLIKFSENNKHFCRCYWNRPSAAQHLDYKSTQAAYLNKYDAMAPFVNTKVFENFLSENAILLFYDENKNICRDEGIRFIIPNTKQVLEKESLFDKYKFLLKHSPKRINPTCQYNVYSTFNLITQTFRISNRSFFFKHEIKKQSFIGKTSMPINNSVLAINLLGLCKNIVYDPFCGAGSLLFLSSLFGCLVSGTDLHKKQLIGFNVTDTNVRTSLKGFDVLSNFKQFNTFDRVLFFGRKNVFSQDVNITSEYIFSDLPYGVRSKKTENINEYIKKLKYLFDKYCAKGICFWIESGYDSYVREIFSSVPIYALIEKLKTCQRMLYVFVK
ncbi:tRNA (guanine(10)-N2)-methyltransferase [Cucumispora dikerogammari]|nr:tRNA (guanine(10)-N2)-methyltransferase [Cucumispora dikerogammari]